MSCRYHTPTFQRATLIELIAEVEKTIVRLVAELEHYQNQHDATVSKLRGVRRTHERLMNELHKSE